MRSCWIHAEGGYKNFTDSLREWIHQNSKCSTDKAAEEESVDRFQLVQKVVPSKGLGTLNLGSTCRKNKNK